MRMETIPSSYQGRLPMITLQRIVHLILVIIILGAVWWLLFWLLGYIGLPEPFNKIAHGVLAVGGVFALIAVLLDLAGYPIVNFKGPIPPA